MLRSAENGELKATKRTISGVRCALEQGRAPEPLPAAVRPDAPALSFSHHKSEHAVALGGSAPKRRYSYPGAEGSADTITVKDHGNSGTPESSQRSPSLASNVSLALRRMRSAHSPHEHHGRYTTTSDAHADGDADASLNLSHSDSASSTPAYGNMRCPDATLKSERVPPDHTLWGSISEDLLNERFALNSQTCFEADRLARELDKAIVSLAGKLIERHGLIDSLGLPRLKLERFLSAVNDSYAPAPPTSCLTSRDDLSRLSFMHAPYHNLPHACDVTQCMYHLLFRDGGLVHSLQLNKVEQLAAILAAAAHDMDHEGLSNDFYSRMKDVRALVNGFNSVNERHHVACCLLLTGEPESDPFCTLSAENRAHAWFIMSEMILATDLKQHVSIMSEFKERETDFASDVEGKTLALKMALKVADIAHATHSREQHKLWTDRLEAECWRQGDLEKSYGLAVSPLADRDASKMRHGQTGFFDMVILPMIEAFVSRVCESAQPLLDSARDNRSLWAEQSSDDGTSKDDGNDE
jgi:hypothetical protein